MKTGQGLPLSFIVIAAISALVLILVIAFTVGGLGGFFRQILQPAPEESSTVQSSCRTFCDQLVTVATAAQFRGSTYCTKTFAIDLNDDGSVNTDPAKGKVEAGLNCWGSDIGSECTVQTTGGLVLTAGQNGAPGNCTVSP